MAGLLIKALVSEALSTRWIDWLGHGVLILLAVKPLLGSLADHLPHHD